MDYLTKDVALTVFTKLTITGAVIGACSAVTERVISWDIEPQVRRPIPIVSNIIETIYKTSDLALNATGGAAIGGLFTATLPVSLPAYCYFRTMDPNKKIK